MSHGVTRLTIRLAVAIAAGGLALPALADQAQTGQSGQNQGQQNQQNQGQQNQGAPANPVGEAPPTPQAPAQPAQVFDEPTALTPRGHFVFEPSAQYVHSTNNQVALVGYTILPAITIGLINIERVESNLDNFSLTGRYGITPRLELEVRVPYVVADTTTETRPLATASTTNEFFNASGSDIGDVEVALRTQLNHFNGDNAVYLASLRFKTHTGTNIFEEPIDPDTGLQTKIPTGSGFNSVQGGVTFLKPSDPAVFFGGVAYTKSFSRYIDVNYGYVYPGNILDLNLGMGMAINDKASLSIGYQHSVVSQTDQQFTGPADDQTTVNQSQYAITKIGTIQIGTLRFGISYQLSKDTYLNTTIGIGVTRDSPDLEATVRLPIRF
jgi:hypothetical protein